jgi:hypothetical protein
MKDKIKKMKKRHATSSEHIEWGMTMGKSWDLSTIVEEEEKGTQVDKVGGEGKGKKKRPLDDVYDTDDKDVLDDSGIAEAGSEDVYDADDEGDKDVMNDSGIAESEDVTAEYGGGSKKRRVDIEGKKPEADDSFPALPDTGSRDVDDSVEINLLLYGDLHMPLDGLLEILARDIGGSGDF